MSTSKGIPESDRSKINLANTTAESFTKLYYEYVDKMRHKLSKLYHQEGSLVWNGNHVSGGEKIQKFFEELPPSEHILVSLDSQPVGESAVNETTLLIATSGFVTFQSKKHAFQQAFVITVLEEKWKVVSDCFRFQV